jgi:WD40 repeat protein
MRYPITLFTTEEYEPRWGRLLLASALVVGLVGWLFVRASGPVREWPAYLPGPVYLTFGANNTLLIANRETVTSYDIESGEAVDTLTRPEPIGRIATNDDGRFLLLVVRAGLTLWSLPTHQQLATVPVQEICGLYPPVLAISPDGGRLAWLPAANQPCSAGAGVTVWDVRSQQVVQSIPIQGDIDDLQFSLDGRSLALLGKPFELYDIASGALRYRVEHMQAVTISPDQRWLVCIRQTPGQDTLEVRQFADGQLVHSLDSPGRDYRALAVSPNGRYLATAYEYSSGMWLDIFSRVERPIALRSMETGALVQHFTGHTYGSPQVRFTPDGRYLVSYGSTLYSFAIRAWRVAPYPAWVRWLWLWLTPTLVVAALLRGLWRLILRAWRADPSL